MKINNIEKLSFGLGGGVNAIKTDFFVWYLGAYYLTVLGLNPILTGSALLFALFVDAISDPLIGALSDRIKSSFGRRHIFMGFSLVPISITYFMLFIPDKSWSEGLLFFWLLSFTILTRFSVTLFDIPHRALAAEIPDTYEDKANIMSMREGFQSIIALSHSFIILPYINIDVDENWVNVGLVGSLMMFVFGLVSILGTRSLIPDLYEWPQNIEKKNTYKEIKEQLSLIHI